MSNWRPTASLVTMRWRTALLATIRNFFANRGLMEVDVPVLGRCGVTDVHIDCIEVADRGLHGYLQSSPEYFMKRLLAAGSSSIYYLGKAFRHGEAGSRHNPEFTMLEWYRTGWDEIQLMDEVEQLIRELSSGRSLVAKRIAYGELFEKTTGFNPHGAEQKELQSLAADLTGRHWQAESRSNYLDLIFSHAVEPVVPAGLVFVYNYPACQAALAKITVDGNGQRVARRFEVYLDGIELANGYCELTDAAELRDRFSDDNARRREMNKPPMEIDENLLDAMEHGLPECSGVALGVDRLLMCLANKSTIDQVLSFTDFRAGSE